MVSLHSNTPFSVNRSNLKPQKLCKTHFVLKSEILFLLKFPHKNDLRNVTVPEQTNDHFLESI